MSGCCENHKKDEEINVKESLPKSPIRLYLYKLGKSDSKKEKSKKGCC
jgi:hypothetical protein